MVFQIPLALWNILVPILEYLAVTTMVFPRSNAVIFLPALAAAACNVQTQPDVPERPRFGWLISVDSFYIPYPDPTRYA